MVNVTAAPPPTPGTATVRGKVTGFLGMAVAGASVKIGTTEKTTDSSGLYEFLDLQPGTFTLTVTSEPLYQTFEKSLTLAADQVYAVDITLALKWYVMGGIIAAPVAIGAGVAYAAARPKAPSIPAGFELTPRAPPGYELVPKAPPGYRLVRE